MTDPAQAYLQAQIVLERERVAKDRQEQEEAGLRPLPPRLGLRPPDLEAPPQTRRFAPPQEELAQRSTFPRRNRWKGLVELDRQRQDLERRREELIAQRQALEQQTTEAADSDRAALAVWVAGGEQGERPAPTAPTLGSERDQIAATLEAVEVAIGKALEERVKYVQRHRVSMIRDARRQIETWREKYLALLAELRSVRTELLDARATETWVSLYPHELATVLGGNEANLSLGLLKPVAEALGITHQLAAEQVLQALEADAHTISERLTPEQRKELGTAAAPTPETGAMWHDDPSYQEWAKNKRRELNELAQYARPDQLRQLGREMRDD
jgi:hypothetical protein